jgi:hypothetical protein
VPKFFFCLPDGVNHFVTAHFFLLIIFCVQILLCTAKGSCDTV